MAFLTAACLQLATLCSTAPISNEQIFGDKVAPIFEKHCLSCHHGAEAKGGLRLETAKSALAGGESGAVIVPGKPDDSLLADYISGDKPEMPKNAPPLSAAQVAAIREWIAGGAAWPEKLVLKDRKFDGAQWWSLQSLRRPAVPKTAAASGWSKTPIDAFILETLQRNNLKPTKEADRRTLIRRLYSDLLGLPPKPEAIDAFVNDSDPRAYEKLVDTLLDSKHYGERWARHWLDIVHYGDTHGYDKDKLRPNAWPYRDYVIRAFNDDKPYGRFVAEQLAGDLLYPDTTDGIVALGFIAAGPFDFVGQIELREGSLDKQITRNLDRDDMVATAMNTFVSLTAQCARCHDHKFDPIKQEDYYSLQAVFAAVDRADRPYETNSTIAQQRAALEGRQKELAAKRQALEKRIAELAGPELGAIDKRVAELQSQGKGGERAEFGYHSALELNQSAVKWVQVKLGKSLPIEQIIIVGCHDDFNNIGAGFGFPVRYKVEVSDDVEFKAGVIVISDRTAADVANPGVAPQNVAARGHKARFVRVTATKLAPRLNDYIFALAELLVLVRADSSGSRETSGGQREISDAGTRILANAATASSATRNAARGAAVTSLDSIEAPVRWTRKNLTDGYYFGVGKVDNLGELSAMLALREKLIERAAPKVKADLAAVDRAVEAIKKEQATLPPPQMVFAAATHFVPAGSFTPTYGKPRPIHVLHRGSEKSPKQLVGPGAVACIPDLPSRFS